jgi:hypothetical protein
MYDVVVQLLRDYLPAGQDFVIRHWNALVNRQCAPSGAGVLAPNSPDFVV